MLFVFDCLSFSCAFSELIASNSFHGILFLWSSGFSPGFSSFTVQPQPLQENLIAGIVLSVSAQTSESESEPECCRNAVSQLAIESALRLFVRHLRFHTNLDNLLLSNACRKKHFKKKPLIGGPMSGRSLICRVFTDSDTTAINNVLMGVRPLQLDSVIG